MCISETVKRANVAGAADAQPGDKVLVMSDGSMRLQPVSTRPTEAARTIGAPAE